MFSSFWIAAKFILTLLAIFIGVVFVVLFLGGLVREWRLERKRPKPVSLLPDLPPMLPEPPVEFCPGCKAEIDPEWCWCGDLVPAHNPYNSGHSPVPMGCVCHQRSYPSG